MIDKWCIIFLLEFNISQAQRQSQNCMIYCFVLFFKSLQSSSSFYFFSAIMFEMMSCICSLLASQQRARVTRPISSINHHIVMLNLPWGRPADKLDYNVTKLCETETENNWQNEREAASIHNVLTLKDNSRLVINGNVECITWILPGSQKLDMFDV